MIDLLARQRLRGNLIDRTNETERHTAQVRDTALTTDGEGRIAADGLLLRIGEPVPPPPGYILLYAEEVAGVVYLRAMDETETVKLVTSW